MQTVAESRLGSGSGLSHFQVCRAVELAFMAVCAAWEDLLEASMVRYLAGARTTRGYSPELRCGTCTSIPHAYQVLSGDPGYAAEKKHMSWTSPAGVVGLARVFFVAGEPYNTPIGRDGDKLKQAFKVRNRVAHASERCKTDFKKAANVILGRKEGTSLGQRFRVGHLMLQACGGFFGKNTAALNIPVFEAYMRLFEKLAHEIVLN